MKMFDVNVLIYAHREDQLHHPFYREYVEEVIESGELFALSPLVAAGFVRIVTNAAFPNGPTPLAQALAVVDNIASVESCYWTPPGTRHWQLVSLLCRQCHCTGKMVSDAQHAAIAIEHASIWVTRDDDFQAFLQHGLQLELVRPA